MSFEVQYMSQVTYVINQRGLLTGLVAVAHNQTQAGFTLRPVDTRDQPLRLNLPPASIVRQVNERVCFCMEAALAISNSTAIAVHCSHYCILCIAAVDDKCTSSKDKRGYWVVDGVSMDEEGGKNSINKSILLASRVHE